MHPLVEETVQKFVAWLDGTLSKEQWYAHIYGDEVKALVCAGDLNVAYETFFRPLYSDPRVQEACLKYRGQKGLDNVRRLAEREVRC
jgi:hypothetical protein